MNARISLDPNSPEAQKIRRSVLSRVKLSAFMGAKLPLALMAGLRITSIDASHCSVTVPYGWRTTNPFRSTYFAALSMAAEMSTGALSMSLVQASPQPISMLIVGMDAEFTKKATGLTTFTCADGEAVADAMIAALNSDEGVSVRTESVGRDAQGDVVATFHFTWSLRKKRSK